MIRNSCTLFVLFTLLLIPQFGYAAEDWSQGNWRWRNDDGDESSATWKAAENTGFNLSNSNNIRLRIEVYADNEDDPRYFGLHYRVGTTSENWYRITGSPTGRHFVLSSSNGFDNSEPTSEQLSERNGYSFITGKMINSSQCALQSPITGLKKSEWEWCIKATGSVTNSIYEFRLMRSNSTCSVSVNQLYRYASYPSLTYSPVTIPTLITNSISNLSLNSVSSGGNSINDGGAAITQKGVVWGTSMNPTTTSNIGITNNGTGNDDFTSSITGLSTSTIYFARAYATNTKGTGYGTSVEFKTLPNQASQVLIKSITPNSLTIDWTNGNGDGRVVFVKPDSEDNATPIDGQIYTGNSVYGNGTEIGDTEWYAVASGNVSGPITVNNVSPLNNDYKVMVCEYVTNSGNHYYNKMSASNNPQASASTVYLSNDFSDQDDCWMSTCFNRWIDIKTKFPEGGAKIIVQNYIYPDNIDDAPVMLDISGYTVSVGNDDFTVLGSIKGGLIATLSSGKLILKSGQTGGESNFPLTDGINNFSVKIICDNEESEFEVKLNENSDVAGALTDLWDITGADNSNATIIFRIDKAAISPKKLGSNSIIRYYDAEQDRYVPISSDRVTIIDMGLYYEITVIGVNKF